MNILITGCAGFIGFHLSKKILQDSNHKVLGIDNLNNYYSTKIKIDRLIQLKKHKKFYFKKIDRSNYDELRKIFLRIKLM